ncbi:MAG TPA: hypothetical protein VI318_06410, partial [Baekduia sp.]
GVGGALAVDAGGAATAVLVGTAGGAKLVQRAGALASWGAAEPLPGRALGHAAGPVVAAAGAGAAVVAWRVDTPKKYGAIVALARDPRSAAFGAPVVVSGSDPNGVRHPAVAVDGEGRALLAYNTDTRRTHLSLKGAIAVVVRRGAGRGFSAPVVVDKTPASPPAVALSADGRGVVAWVRDRRIWAASIDAGAGRIGRPVALTRAGSYRSVRVAAGPGGAATVAFRTTVGSQRRPAIAALRRPAGGTLRGRKAQVLATAGPEEFIDTVALAADEDGRATAAWSPERFDQDKTLGVNGVISGISAASAEPSAQFGPVRVVAPPTTQWCSLPSLAASAGHTALAWTCRDKKAFSIWSTRDLSPPTSILTGPAPTYYASNPTTVTTGLDTTTTTTLLITRPDPPTDTKAPTPPTERVLTTTGR